MQKRGTSQIDWIMSLALFLLYIGWFFVFISPQISLGANKDSLMIVLKDNFHDQFSWELDKFPVFIESEKSGLYPIVFDYNPNNSDIRFLDGTEFVIWDSKLIFQANLTPNMTTYWVTKGGGYSHNYESTGFDRDEDQATVENMTVRFENMLLDYVNYRNQEKITDVQYRVNNEALFADNTSFEDYGFAAFYRSNSEINHTTIVFSGGKEIYNFVNTGDAEYTLALDIVLDDYQSYYTDNTYFGNFTYAEGSEIINYTADHVTVYDGHDLLSIFFDNNVSLNFSAYNTTLDLEVRMPLTNGYEYKYVFHEGDYENVSRREFDYRYGVSEVITGINLDNITTGYASLKAEWQFPKDFNIRVYENSSAFIYAAEPTYEIGIESSSITNVYAETEDSFALTANGSLIPISVNYRIW